LARSTLVVVKALDPSGKQVRIRAKDNLLAQALEHETDHLNGTLYVDHLPSMDVLRRIDQQDEDDEGDEGDEDEEAEEEPEAAVQTDARPGARSD
jgi:peptide deformylase